METIRRQIHEESTMINMLDKNLDNDQRELDALTDAETARAQHVRIDFLRKIFWKNFLFRLNVLRQIYKIDLRI